MTDENEPKLQLRTDDVEWREIGGEVVGVDTRTAMYLSMKGSAGVLFARLREGATRGELVSALLDAFDVERTQAEADVDAFVDDLGARDLLA